MRTRSDGSVLVATTGRCRGDRHPYPSDGDLLVDHVRLAEDDDPAALDRLVRAYERYARSLASRLYRGHESREDLEQIALEALVVALRRFDPGRGIPFRAFARPTVLGLLHRHFRDHGWLVRVPRSAHDMASTIRDTRERLTAELGREPTESEIASEIGLGVDELRHFVDVLHVRDTRSLDAPVGDVGTGIEVGADDANFERAVQVVSARGAIERLDDLDCRLIRDYYIEDRTQSQMARDMGVSQMQVSRLIRAAMDRLRSMACAGRP